MIFLGFFTRVSRFFSFPSFFFFFSLVVCFGLSDLLSWEGAQWPIASYASCNQFLPRCLPLFSSTRFLPSFANLLEFPSLSHSDPPFTSDTHQFKGNPLMRISVCPPPPFWTWSSGVFSPAVHTGFFGAPFVTHFACLALVAPFSRSYDPRNNFPPPIFPNLFPFSIDPGFTFSNGFFDGGTGPPIYLVMGTLYCNHYFLQDCALLFSFFPPLQPFPFLLTESPETLFSPFCFGTSPSCFQTILNFFF